jgi:hypothetical protein
MNSYMSWIHTFYCPCIYLYWYMRMNSMSSLNTWSDLFYEFFCLCEVICDNKLYEFVEYLIWFNSWIHINQCFLQSFHFYVVTSLHSIKLNPVPKTTNTRWFKDTGLFLSPATKQFQESIEKSTKLTEVVYNSRTLKEVMQVEEQCKGIAG